VPVRWRIGLLILANSSGEWLEAVSLKGVDLDGEGVRWPNFVF